jgi:ribokinase
MAGPIVVVGSSNVDLVMKVPRLPRRGETVTDGEFTQVFGGKGANQAVGAARAGGRVVFVGCVGEDAYGPQVVESLRRDGIDTSHVFAEPGVASGTALIMVGGEGHNCIAVAPGANYRLTPERVDRARDALAAAACVVTQCEILPQTLDHVVDLAAGMGKPVVLNLAPARAVSERTLARLSCLAVNESEAEFLAGRAVASDADVEAAASELRRRGPRTVVLTLGSRGAYVDGEGVRALVPAFPVEAVDTTAAGDVHCGALAVALVEGRPLAEAVRFANAAAALSVTRLGAQPSAPTRAEIDALLARA